MIYIDQRGKPTFKSRYEGGHWIATCEVLRCMGSSPVSEEAAIDELYKDIQTTIEVHQSNGTLRKWFISIGVVKEIVMV